MPVSQATQDARKQRRADHVKPKVEMPKNNPRGPRAEKPSDQRESFAVKAPKAIKVRTAAPKDLE